jgi:CBS domain-containing protein
MSTHVYDEKISPEPAADAIDPGRVLVGALMGTPVVAVRDVDSAWTAMERFVVAGTRHLVVVTAEGRCAGVLANHHIAALWPLDPLGLQHRLVGDLIDGTEVPAVLASDTVASAAHVMVTRGVDAVTVVDPDVGDVVGVLTGGDIVRLVARGA